MNASAAAKGWPCFPWQSPAGKRYGRTHGSLEITDSLSDRLVRPPLWVALTGAQQDQVVQVLADTLRQAA